MSYTTILAIYPDEKIEDIKRFSNSWLSAALLWEEFGKKYVKPNFSIFNIGDDFWAKARDKAIPFTQRVVLAMTYDRFMIYAKDYSRAAKDIRDSGYQGHWPDIADFLESPDVKEVPCIGFHLTSVSENPFEQYDDETEECSIRWDDTVDLYEYMDKYS